MKIINFDSNVFPFPVILLEWFNVDNLESLHEQKKYINIFLRKEDQNTIWHNIFYNNIKKDNMFNILYINFLKKHIKPLYKEKIVYQKIPSLRVHLKDNVAVGEFHKDKDYRDEEWTNIVKEKNYYLPLTNTNKYNTFWVESQEDKKDYKPVLLNYGECLEWDGLNLTHGNKKNISDYTRVSIDFRVMPLSRYVESNFSSINTNTKFKLGEYYSLL